jgi:4-cresol dehydrogenase (hydroxylating)
MYQREEEEYRRDLPPNNREATTNAGLDPFAWIDCAFSRLAHVKPVFWGFTKKSESSCIGRGYTNRVPSGRRRFEPSWGCSAVDWEGETVQPDSSAREEDTEAIRAALDEWATLLGAEGVSNAPDVLRRYSRTTQAEAPSPGCVVWPTTTEQVQTVARIASAHGIILYPISRGKNWGYGDACATTDGAAIVDLSRMNRILEVNTELAYCVIEPGVSQKELYDYLQENESGLWMDASAAGPDSSLVGNTLDRGFGHTRYGDHFLTCCGMEVVLADGRVVRTGFGHYSNARATHVYRYGVGPFLDGIFCQSNLGIVTRIGLWLLPEPESFEFFYFQAPHEEDLATLVDRLRPLRIAGTLQTAIHIGNDFRVLAGSGRYPWEEAGHQAPLPPDTRKNLRRSKGLQAWQGSGSISGAKGQVRAAKKLLRQALRGVATVRFLNDWKLELAERCVFTLNKVGLAKVLGCKLRVLRPNYELLKGIPTPEPLISPQWRLRTPPEGGPCDPLDVGCGLYWISPVMPMLGSETAELRKLAEPIFAEFGFDMIVSFILISERSLVAIFNIAFDQSEDGEPERASQCYDTLVNAMHEAGFYIYRAGLQGMEKLRTGDPEYWEVLRDIKRALDPEDLIARGRYIPPLDEG